MSDMSKAIGGIGSGGNFLKMATQPLAFLNAARDNDIVKTAVTPGKLFDTARERGGDLFSGRIGSRILTG